MAFFVEGSELLQELVASADGGRAGWVDEGEGFDITKRGGFQAQDDFREVGALNLRLAEGRADLVFLLAVEAETDAVLHAP